MTHYVIGQNARPAPPVRRKATDRPKDTSDKKKKTPERSNSQPESSSSEDKVVDKMAKGRRSTSPLDRGSSPSHATSVASYAADEFILRNDEFSDDEKGYHTDQDSGFQLINGRKRFNRQHRMSRLPVNRQNFQNSRPNVLTTATPSSPTASSSPSFSGTAFSVSGASASASGSANLRGYESEKEFYPDNFSSRQATVRRRKTASSMPHSERNSPENSDVDSSLSLPIVHRTPPPAPPPVTEDEHSGRISYAQIARAASAAAAAASATGHQSSLRSSTSTGISSSSSASGVKTGTGAAADNGAKVKAMGKTAPPKSNAGDEGTAPHDNLSADTRRQVASSATGASAGVTGESRVKHKDEMRDATLTKTTTTQTIGRILSPSSPTSGDKGTQIRKQNSIPDSMASKSLITTRPLNRSLDSAPRPQHELPAVIMCDSSSTSQEDEETSVPAASVTFGFFDDDADEGTTQLTVTAVTNGAHENQKPSSAYFEDEGLVHDASCHSSPGDCNAEHSAGRPEAGDQRSEDRRQQSGDERRVSEGGRKAKLSVGPSSISYPPDVDIETFNYNEILAYIRKGLFLFFAIEVKPDRLLSATAWESVIRTDGSVYVRSFSSGSVVSTPEKTSLA